MERSFNHKEDHSSEDAATKRVLVDMRFPKLGDQFELLVQVIKEINKDEMPPIYGSDLKDIIHLNKKDMTRKMDSFRTVHFPVMSIEEFEKFMASYKKNKDQFKHVKRIEMLRGFLEFRKRRHLEMVDFNEIRKLIDIKKLKCLFSKEYFINFTVQENATNDLLSIQGYFLKCFIYFHMKHDMRFKATIDSFMIEMDNPYTRNAIREHNKSNEELSKNYIENPQFNIEDFCQQLLDKFFPSNISGMWCQFNHMAPAYILQMVKISFEYGFISPSRARLMLPSLAKAADSLLKLEASWKDPTFEEKRISVKAKVRSIMTLFSKCREHMAMIIIQMLVLLNDEVFMKKYPDFIADASKEDEIKKDIKKSFILFNKEFNDDLLFITMNYLSIDVEILGYRAITDFCKVSVEKIYLFLTTIQRDCFLNSLKQVTVEDLYTFQLLEKNSVDPQKAKHASQMRDDAIKYSNSLKKILELISRGVFEPGVGKMNPNYPEDTAYLQLLKQYSDSSTANLPEFLQKLTLKLIDLTNIMPDFKVFAAIEAIPLILIAIVDYCADYKHDKRPEFRLKKSPLNKLAFAKDTDEHPTVPVPESRGRYFNQETYDKISMYCFDAISALTRNNNFSKAQMFKGDGFYHLKKLLSNLDIQAFMYLFTLSSEPNSAAILGRDVFYIFLQTYESFNKEICTDLQDHADLAQTTNRMDVTKCGTLLVMLKFLTKIITKPFLNESEKLRTMMLTQEIIFEHISKTFLPILCQFIEGYCDKTITDSDRKSLKLTPEHFLSHKEHLLLKVFNDSSQNPNDINMALKQNDKLIVLLQISFLSVRLFNRICTDCFSYNHMAEIVPYVDRIQARMEDPSIKPPTATWLFPIGFESELVNLVRNFKILPEQQVLIENHMGVRATILDLYQEKTREKFEVDYKKRTELNAIRKQLEEQKNDHADDKDIQKSISNITVMITNLDKKIEENDKKVTEAQFSELKFINTCFNRVNHYIEDKTLGRPREQEGDFLLPSLQPQLPWPSDQPQPMETQQAPSPREGKAPQHADPKEMDIPELQKLRRSTDLEMYVMEGVLPLYYMYLTSVQKLSPMDNNKKIRTAFYRTLLLIKMFDENFNMIIKVSGAKLDFAEELKSIALKKDKELHHFVNFSGTLDATLISGCTEAQIENYVYKGCELLNNKVSELYNQSRLAFLIADKKDISKKDMENNTFILKFEAESAKPNKDKDAAASHTDTNDDHLIVGKRRIFLDFVKAYQECKDEYLSEDSPINLYNFFDRNTQNLRGVFNSCLDRLLSRSKQEKTSGKLYLAKNYPISKFWCRPSTIAYITMIGKLLSFSSKVRDSFYEFLAEEKEEAPEVDDDEEPDQPTVPQNGLDSPTKTTEKLEDIKKKADDAISGRAPNNENEVRKTELSENAIKDKYEKLDPSSILSILIRIQADLILFLNNSSQRNSIWWVAHETYEMICSFFKNLCEGNNMPFKEYLGKERPMIIGKTWERFREKPYTEVFCGEFKYVIRTTRLAENREPELVASDYHERVQEIILPLLTIINETIIGPCSVNQEIVTKSFKSEMSSLCNIATRVIDDMHSDYYQLTDISLSIFLGLCEGFNEASLKQVSSKFPASLIVDRILRFMKKLYVKQKILNGELQSFEAREKEEKEREEAKQKGGIHIKFNKIVPLKFTNVIKKMLFMKTDDEDTDKPFVVNEEMENEEKIEDWSDLYDMYMSDRAFSESSFFSLVFRLFVLWKTLSENSYSHKNRMEEAKAEVKKLFSEQSFLSSAISLGNLSKTLKLGKLSKALKLNKLSSAMKLHKLKDLATLGMGGKKRREVDEKESSDNPSEFASIFYFLSKKTNCEIEVISDTKKSVILTFPRLPACFLLSEEAKKNYRNECEIVDANTKMVDLMSNYDLFCIQMRSSFITKRILGKFYIIISTDAFYYYTFLCWIIGLGLNITLCLGLVRSDTGSNFVYKDDSYTQAMYIFTTLLSVLSGVLLFIWFITKYPQTYETKLEHYKFQNPGKNPKSKKAILYVAIWESYIKQNFALSYSLHLIFTIVGYYTHPIVYTLNLLLIINISNTTKFVLNSIILHIDQLALTLMLCIFVIYIYTFIVMGTYYQQSGISEKNNNLVCTEAYMCFLFVFNLGFRAPGGFPGIMNSPILGINFPGRITFDISFFMLIVAIALNIIFGIIIDTFSELRDAQNERSKQNV